MDKAAPNPLQAIRQRIDAIDEQMHRLLIDRSGVVAELIRVKGTSKPGAAFRPDREAEMMRRLAFRHAGGLPLVTVEHLWREIITAFTALQAPFGVFAPPAADPLALRDAIRFYFGFSVPVTQAVSAEAAIESVAASGRDIAVIPKETKGRWWDGLAGTTAPKVFAKIPFIEAEKRPAALPAYVVGPPLKDVALPDVRLYRLQAGDGLEAAVLAHEGRVTGRKGDQLLVELPVAVELSDIAPASSNLEPAELGGFAQPIRVLAEPTH